MKLLHTSDWHLGRMLFGKKRYEEFERFLDWLLQTIATRQVDVLVVAGDVFDTTTPPNRAQEQYYRFLIEARNAGCRHVIIVAGNHDSPSFLDAPRPLLGQLNVHVVGTAKADAEDEVLVLRDAAKKPEAIVCAVPYLRDRDVRRSEAGESQEERDGKMTLGIAAHYDAVLQAALGAVENSDHLPIIATGHLFTSGAKTIDGDGVRELYVGNLVHVTEGIFSPRFDYVALGHLHVSQQVGNRANVRYCGSPLPMGFGEADQQKEVQLLEWHGRKLQLEAIAVPVFQTLLRLEGDIDEIEAAILREVAKGQSLWLEVEYTGQELMPDLRQRVESLVLGSPLEVLRIGNRTVFNQVLRSVEAEEELGDLDVADVFVRCLDANEIPDAQRAELIACHQQILQSLQEADTQRE